MKKILFLILIFMVVMVAVACNPSKENELSSDDSDYSLSEEEEDLTIDMFYPYLENTLLEYRGIGNEFAEQNLYFEFIDGNRAQIKIENPGTNITKVVEYRDGALRENYSEGEFYHIENIMEKEDIKENIILMEPLEIGNSWQDPDGNTREITALDREIETPYKTLKALEVTSKKDKAKTLEYYVRGIGLVARIYEEGDLKIKTLLESITPGPKQLAIKKFYPIDIDADNVYVEGEISFETNEDILIKLGEVLANPPSEKLIPLISPETKINFIKLDRKDWKLRVDFSPELVLDMNYGTTMETKILEAIVNTLGSFYDVGGINITVDGKDYESGHYLFKEDEFLEVNTEGLELFEP